MQSSWPTTRTKASISTRLLGSCLTLVSDQSKARDILTRRHRSEKEKGAGKNDAKGTSGQAMTKKSNGEKQSSDEDQKDPDSDEEEENDDEDQVDKGPAICSVCNHGRVPCRRQVPR
jgi:hypothetical protein